MVNGFSRYIDIYKRDHRRPDGWSPKCEHTAEKAHCKPLDGNICVKICDICAGIEHRIKYSRNTAESTGNHDRQLFHPFCINAEIGKPHLILPDSLYDLIKR